MTESVPTGASDDAHDPLPPDSAAVHRSVDPIEMVTDPVGVPPVEETTAEYVTGTPATDVAGVAETEVAVGLKTS